MKTFKETYEEYKSQWFISPINWTRWFSDNWQYNWKWRTLLKKNERDDTNNKRIYKNIVIDHDNWVVTNVIEC